VRVLVTAGLLFYIAWLGGTIFGSLIGSLSEFTEVSSAALPVLFVALASAMARSRGTVARCVVAVGVTLAASIALPSLQPFLPVAVALGVATVWSVE
jgi:predicted branched-subunit amino acid permease